MTAARQAPAERLTDAELAGLATHGRSYLPDLTRLLREHSEMRALLERILSVSHERPGSLLQRDYPVLCAALADARRYRTSAAVPAVADAGALEVGDRVCVKCRKPDGVCECSYCATCEGCAVNDRCLKAPDLVDVLTFIAGEGGGGRG